MVTYEDGGSVTPWRRFMCNDSVFICVRYEFGICVLFIYCVVALIFFVS